MGAPVGRFPRVLFLQAPCPLLPRGRESCSGETFGALWGGCMDGRNAPPAGCSAKGSGDLREGRRRAVRRRTQTRSGNRGRQRARGRPGSPGVETKGWQDRAPPAGPASCPPATGRRIRGRGEHPAGTSFLPRRHGLPRVQNSNFLWCIRTPGWVSSNPGTSPAGDPVGSWQTTPDCMGLHGNYPGRCRHRTGRPDLGNPTPTTRPSRRPKARPHPRLLALPTTAATGRATRSGTPLALSAPRRSCFGGRLDVHHAVKGCRNAGSPRDRWRPSPDGVGPELSPVETS